MPACGVLFLFCLVALAAPPARKLRPMAPASPIREGETIDATKSRVLVERGLRLIREGEYPKACEAFEEAHELTPAQPAPLYFWGMALYQVGLYDLARERLDQIGLARMSPGGQAQVLHLKGRVMAAAGDLPAAMECFQQGISKDPGFTSTRIWLAWCEHLSGNDQAAASRLDGIRQAELGGCSQRDQVIAHLAQMRTLQIHAAMETLGPLSQCISHQSFADGERPWGFEWFSQPLWVFAFLFPLGLPWYLGLVYAAALLGGLVVAARQVTDQPLGRDDGAFLGLAVAHLLILELVAGGRWREVLLFPEFDPYGSAWVYPKALMSLNLLTIGLFAIYPLFGKLLDPALRPRRRELFAIWFFLFHFVIAVILFQSKGDLLPRLLLLLPVLSAMGMAALSMPLARYLLYLAGGNVQIPAAGGGAADAPAELGFAEAKIIEDQAMAALQMERFSDALAMARRVFNLLPRESFPYLWESVIRVRLEQDDIVEAGRELTGYQRQFPEGSPHFAGRLLEARLQELQGNSLEAFRILQAIPAGVARGFSAEQAAESLWLLAQHHRRTGEAVQAHMELGQALKMSRTPTLQARILLALIALDGEKGKIDRLDDWRRQLAGLKAGDRTRASIHLAAALVAYFRGDLPMAQAEAEAAGKVFPPFADAWFWLGMTMIRQGRGDSVSEILTHLSPASGAAIALRAEISRPRKAE